MLTETDIAGLPVLVGVSAGPGSAGLPTLDAVCGPADADVVRQSDVRARRRGGRVPEVVG